MAILMPQHKIINVLHDTSTDSKTSLGISIVKNNSLASLLSDISIEHPIKIVWANRLSIVLWYQKVGKLCCHPIDTVYVITVL